MSANKLGPIKPDEVYPLGTFQALSGMGAWALRSARRQGLRVLRFGTRGYVRGSDFRDFLERQSIAEKDRAENPKEPQPA